MTIRQQYANEELVHKLRSMLNDLPTLRTRAMKKLEHWREAAIKRLLARQRELEKTLLDKFERLEFDTQLFVEKTERKRAQHQRRWQSEPLDYLNKSEIDRISTSLRSIREELEQSKLILAGNLTNDNIGELSSETVRHEKLAETSARYTDHISSKTAVHKNYNSSPTDNDLNLELKRVLEICTSPQCSSTSLSADEQTPLPSLDSVEHSYDAKAKQTTPTKTGTTCPQRRPDDRSRRHARIITNVLSEQQENEISSPTTPASNNSSKTFSFESFDDSMRRFQRLREVRQNLRYKYDETSPPSMKMEEITQPINIPIERIITPTPSNENNVGHQQRQRDHDVNTSNRTRDRKYRSKTLEGNQLRAVDNQIYGCSTASLASKAKQDTPHRGDLHRHRSHRLSFRRSTDDVRSTQLHLRRHLDANDSNLNDIWLEIGQEHWTNLLENGWRPTTDTTGVNLVSFADSDDYGSNKQTTEENSVVDLYEQITRNEYISLFEKLDFSYARTIDLGNEFWRFLEISGSQHLCLYHQLNKQFILFKPDTSLLSFQWPYDGIIDISWSKFTNTWVVATQTQITICNRSFSKVLQTADINGDWPKRITSCRSSIFHTYKLPASSNTKTFTSAYSRSSYKDRPQFLLERYDYKLKSICKHILESSTIWDIEADDLTDHLAVLCDFALLIFDYQLNLLRQIEVTGFKVSTDHFGGWLIADYNASCIWQIRRNEYLKANKILHVERPWSVILDRTNWTLITLSETTNRAKRLLFYTMKNIPETLLQTDLSCAQSQLSMSSSSSVSESLL